MSWQGPTPSCNRPFMSVYLSLCVCSCPFKRRWVSSVSRSVFPPHSFFLIFSSLGPTLRDQICGKLNEDQSLVTELHTLGHSPSQQRCILWRFKIQMSARVAPSEARRWFCPYLPELWHPLAHLALGGSIVPVSDIFPGCACPSSLLLSRTLVVASEPILLV